MIQAMTSSNLKAYLQTEDTRIDTSVPSGQIKHLLKFTNDMDGSVDYAYAATETIYDRYTYFLFNYNANPDIYAGQINFLPAGYWKYEAYEVSWSGASPTVSLATAPATELDVIIPASPEVGVVQGLVTKGKMYVSERPGTEQVTYSQNGNQVVTITIVSGGTGYAAPPTITITGGGSPITTATATCTVNAGAVNTVTITNAGNGYTSNPTVTLTGGGFTKQAQLVATIEDTNYIYYGQ